MAFVFLPPEVESLVHAIHKFQHDTGHRMTSYIDLALQILVDYVAVTKPINSRLLDVFRKTTRVVAFTSSCFYDLFWLTDIDKFPATVSCFEKVILYSEVIDSSLQQLIISIVIFAVAIAVAVIQTKHKSEMLSLRNMIKKSLLLSNSFSTTPPSNPNATPKTHLDTNSLSKATTERWNQADLGYFNYYLNKTYRKCKIVLVRKDVYYRNVMLFV